MQIEERKSDDELNIKISGRLDTNTAPQLEQYVNDNFFNVPVVYLHKLIIDMSDVPYISSAGVRVIVAAYKSTITMKDKHFKLYIKNPSDFCLQVFDTIGVKSVLNIISSGNHSSQQDTFEIPSPDNSEHSNFKMIKLPLGTFIMGNAQTGTRNVGISEFYISSVPITQFFFKKVMGYNNSKKQGELLPVENVSWYEAVIFCNILSEAYKLQPCYSIKDFDIKTLSDNSIQWKNLTCNFGANGFRLPTEAEWEYAAKAGGVSLYSGGDKLDEYGWYGENSNVGTHNVGEKKPNAFGLYDMSGNISEWCWDWYAPYTLKPETDPHGPVGGKARIKRGGSWLDDAVQCTTSTRESSAPSGRSGTLGFRIARSALS